MALYDFGGYATKNDLRCSDGRTIRHDAFKDCDGLKVPLVWQHLRNQPDNVLGYALLENREDGVYAYGKFNGTKNASTAKTLVEHGDISSMSIYANQLIEKGGNVMHGIIREVSLVLAPANPGALIDNLAIEHSDGGIVELDDEAIITSGLGLEYEEKFELSHADEDADDEDDEGEEEEMTAKEIFDSMNENQKNLLYAMVDRALNDSADDEEDEDADDEEADDEPPANEAKHSDEEGETVMKNNVFDAQNEAIDTRNVLSHADMETIFKNAQRIGSLRTAVEDFTSELQHSIHGEKGGNYADKLPEDVLFPEAKAVNVTPEMIMRNQDWVSKVWNATRKSPFSRVKSTAANLTADEARAKGYQKGKKKMEEVITMLKRVTTPQTVYKLQKMDRDDIIDITDFDVVAWIKAEMRLMLNEELSRAIMIGDGRPSGQEDKINEANIRPVWTDDDLYTIKAIIKQADVESTASDRLARTDLILDTVAVAMEDYMGSGSPVAYMSPSFLTQMKLTRDKIGRRLYNTNAELAAALGVREIVEVPVFKGMKRKGRSGHEEENSKEYELGMLIVNLTDYNVGADRGGAVSMFDDFDIDYNKYTYLIETRCSGALIKPYAAIAVELEGTQSD